jgi:hypothetical protein
MAIPNDRSARLTRKQLADALRELGYPTSAATLATKASRGGGPQYRLYGRVPIYVWGDALDWVESRLSPPRRSTAEADHHAHT